MVSTGSAVALPFYALGRARGLHCHYIESAARSEGPSTDREADRPHPGRRPLLPSSRLWAEGRWRFRGSVFDAFTGAEREDGGTEPEIRKVVVTLGTYKDFGFPLLIKRLLEILPPEAEVLWQTGDTDVSGFRIEGRHAIPEKELTAAMADADLVVAHAGVGAALAALRSRHVPGSRTAPAFPERAHRRPPDPDRGRARRSRRRGRSRSR